MSKKTMKRLILALAILALSFPSQAAYNGSGTFNRLYNWTNDAANGINIRADRMDNEMNGFASGLSTALTKDGQTTATAQIPFAQGLKVSSGAVGTPSIAFTSSATTGFYRVAADSPGLAIAGANQLTVDSAGRFLFHTTAQIPNYTGLNPFFQVVGGTISGCSSAADCSTIANYRQSADSSGPRWILSKSRNATPGSHTIVQSGDTVGTLAFTADDGTNYQPTALIVSKVDGTPGTGDMPGSLIFQTTPDGSSTPTTALTISNAQAATFAGNVSVTGATTLGAATGVTASANDNSTKLATTAYVDAATGKVVQRVNTQTGTVATGSTVIPYDNTIPQNTEGDQYMSLSITPKSATNYLKIEVVCFLASSVAGNVPTAALFQDTTASALAVGLSQTSFADYIVPIVFTHTMLAGTTSATTFKVRGGGATAGTTTFNGAAGVQYFGGVIASSITITEFTP